MHGGHQDCSFEGPLVSEGEDIDQIYRTGIFLSTFLSKRSCRARREQGTEIVGSQRAFRLLILSRAPHAVGGTYGFRSARNVCSRLQFLQTNISLCFPKVLAAGSISLSCSSPPHMQCKEGGGSTRGRM